MNTREAEPTILSDLVPFDDWLASLGRSKVSGWRYRKRHMINTVSLMGRLFVSRRAIAEFERRAKAGEFAHAPKGHAHITATPHA